MSNQLNDFIKSQESIEFATTQGRIMHAKLQFVHIGDSTTGDKDLIAKIMKSSPELQLFFMDNAKTEVPIAGIINGIFVSRRIDRLVIDDTNKIVKILDYKTDTDSDKFRSKYIAQLHEYKSLLQQIYPNYKISCYILWTHNWVLEKL